VTDSQLKSVTPYSDKDNINKCHVGGCGLKRTAKKMRSISTGRWLAVSIILAVTVGQIPFVVSLTQYSTIQLGGWRSTMSVVPALQQKTSMMPFCPGPTYHRHDTKLNAADPIAKTSDSASSPSSSSPASKKKTTKQQKSQQQTSPVVASSVAPDVKQSDDASDVPGMQQSDDADAIAASKFRSLKDYMWIRDTLEDLAAAEFACSVEATTEDPTTALPRRRRAVDYEKLIGKLNGRIEDMMGGRRYMEEINSDVNSSDGEGALILPVGKGMGRVVYTRTQREELLRCVCVTGSILLCSGWVDFRQ
jgi:hypothetical protein